MKTSAFVAAVMLSSTAAYGADWEGPYLGLYLGAPTNVAGGGSLAGVYGGYSFAISDRAIAGVELDLWRGNWGGGGTVASLKGRIGFEVAPDFLLFGVGGYGNATPGPQVWSIGLGGEYALTDNLGLRAEFDRYAPVGGGVAIGVAKLGIGLSF